MPVTLNDSSLHTVIRELKKFSTYEFAVAGFNRIGTGPASYIFIKTDEDGKKIRFLIFLLSSEKVAIGRLGSIAVSYQRAFEIFTIHTKKNVGKLMLRVPIFSTNPTSS